MYTLPSLEIWQGSYPFSYPQDVLGMLLADLDNTHMLHKRGSEDIGACTQLVHTTIG